MKLLVALALAVHVSSSATDGPETQVQLPREKPDPEPVTPQCLVMCQVFDKDSCFVNDDASLTEAECNLRNDESGGFDTTRWCRG